MTEIDALFRLHRNNRCSLFNVENEIVKETVRTMCRLADTERAGAWKPKSHPLSSVFYVRLNP